MSFYVLGWSLMVADVPRQVSLRRFPRSNVLSYYVIIILNSMRLRYKVVVIFLNAGYSR